MTPDSSRETPIFLELTYDNCFEEVEKLQGATQVRSSGLDIWTGEHPSYGRVHIMVPVMGNGMMMLNPRPALAHEEFQPKPMMMSADPIDELEVTLGTLDPASLPSAA